MPTEFFVAKTAQDYKDCHELLDKQGRVAACPLSFPTIIGRRNGRAVCFISTVNAKKAKAIVVGELAVDQTIPRKEHILLKLIECYDAFLLSKGIISYLACIPVENQHYLDMIEKASGIVPYTRDSKFAWINRRIT